MAKMINGYWGWGRCLLWNIMEDLSEEVAIKLRPEW